MLETRFDRYDPAYCIAQFAKQSPCIRNNEAIIAFELDGDDLEIYLPLVEEGVDPHSLELAAEVMAHIAEFDNAVQQSCANECAQSGLAAKYYRLYLAYITIAPNEVKLTYFGEQVNTQWDAIFNKENGKWFRVNA